MTATGIAYIIIGSGAVALVLLWITRKKDGGQ